MSQRTLIAYRALSDLTAKAAFLAVTLLAARALSREAFGTFALGSTFGWIAAVASDFGMQMHLARAVAREPAGARDLFDRWLRVRVAAAAAAFAAGAALVYAWPGAPARAALLLFALAYLASGVLEFVYHFYRGLSRTDLESTLTLWHRLAALACAAAALWLSPSATLLAVALLLPAAATLAASIPLARSLAAKRDGGVFSLDRREKTPPSLFLRDVAPIGAGILLAALYFRVDVFLLQAWRGTEDVARYTAVFRLIEALRLFPAAVLAVTLPALVRATSGRPVAHVSLAVTGGGAATGAVLWLAAGWLIPALYGPLYRDAAPAFRLLAAAFPLMALNYALTHQLIAWNGHRAYAAICAAALAVNVALNAWLIPALSIDGAAWATLATEAVVTAGCATALGRIMPALNGRPAIRHAALSGAPVDPVDRLEMS